MTNIDEEGIGVFNPATWIGCGRVYRDVPLYVANAFAQVRSVPPSAPILQIIPPRELSIKEFIKCAFPARVGDFGFVFTEKSIMIGQGMLQIFDISLHSLTRKFSDCVILKIRG